MFDGSRMGKFKDKPLLCRRLRFGLEDLDVLTLHGSCWLSGNAVIVPVEAVAPSTGLPLCSVLVI